MLKSDTGNYINYFDFSDTSIYPRQRINKETLKAVKEARNHKKLKVNKKLLSQILEGK